MQRIDLKDAHPKPIVVPMESPDTSAATWNVAASGQAVNFGAAGQPALLSLECRLQSNPPELAIVRHAPAKPGLSALFPVIGNGVRSRFLIDAVLHEDAQAETGEWRWEATLPADDPQLDVFTGPRAITATLPGAGMLEIAGSRIPGEFVEWCRKGGAVTRAEEKETDDAAENADEAVEIVTAG